jgi:hypothetical protein
MRRKDNRNSRVNHRRVFFVCALIASFLLLTAGIVLAVLKPAFPAEMKDSIGIFNLLVDIGVGLFTVWGLYWAASEFTESAVKPDLRLLPGESRKPHFLQEVIPAQSRPMLTSPLHIPGWYTVPQQGDPLNRDPSVVLPLYLENEKARAGRLVSIAIRIHATPAPLRCTFTHGAFAVGSQTVQAGKDDDSNCFTLPVQFTENLVVYQAPVYVGQLMVHWDKTLPNDGLPKSIMLDYDAYTLDGASHKGMELSIEWQK